MIHMHHISRRNSNIIIMEHDTVHMLWSFVKDEQPWLGI